MTHSRQADGGSRVLPGSLDRGGRPWRAARLPEPWLDILIAAVIVVVMASPILFTNRPLPIDLTNDIWLGSAMSSFGAHWTTATTLHQHQFI